MILRLIYFFILFISIEIGFGFFIFETFKKSYVSEYNEKLNNAEFKAEDMALNLSRYLEFVTITSEKDNIENYFNRLVKATNTNKYEFIIYKIYLLSTDGSIVAQSYPSVDTHQPFLESQSPLLMRALRMRRGQVESAIYEKESPFESSTVDKKLLNFIGEEANTKMVSSAPIYFKDKMEILGTVHIIYQRFELQNFHSEQKIKLKSQFLYSIIIGLLLSLFLWLIFYFLVSIFIKQSIHENSYEAALSKEIKKKPILTKEDKLENTSKSLDAVYLE
jgi:hypothetical protein